VKPKALDVFLEWNGITESEFIDYINPHRDTEEWEKMPDGAWKCVGCILENNIDLNSMHALDIEDPRDYRLTELLEDQSDFNEYILLGRSYMDKRNYKAIEG